MFLSYLGVYPSTVDSIQPHSIQVWYHLTALPYYMPDTLSQIKAIYEKAARSAGLRRARLLRTKTSRSTSRSTVVTPIVATTTSSLLRVSPGQQQLLQLKVRLASEQEARTRERIIFNENFNQQQPDTVISLITSFCCTCCGFFILYLGIVLLYYYGVYLLRRYQ